MTQIFGKTASLRFDQRLGVRVSEECHADRHVASSMAIDGTKIARFCLTEATELTQDLATLCGAIWWSDRKITRKRATTWARKLHLTVPAFQHALLSRAEVQTALRDALRYSTGDEWTFEFKARTDAPLNVPGLPFGGAPPVMTMPFSDGLDSFAQYKLLCAEYPGREIWRVRTKTRNRAASEEKLLHVPISTFGLSHPEPSYRTRPFVFFVFAALAASAASADKIAIAENGQGSLATALLPFANEWPFRSTHPVFVRKLQYFLNLILPRPVEFVQRQLWRTKGEVLIEMRAVTEGDPAWMETQSCSNNHRSQYGQDMSCGFCGGCLLRRVSVHYAELDAANERYAFDAATHALELRDRSSVRPFSDNEVDILRHGVRSMMDFMHLSSSERMQSRVRGECAEIDPDAPDQALARMLRLSDQHTFEWNTYLNNLPPNSALRRLAA